MHQPIELEFFFALPIFLFCPLCSMTLLRNWKLHETLFWNLVVGIHILLFFFFLISWPSAYPLNCMYSYYLTPRNVNMFMLLWCLDGNLERLLVQWQKFYKNYIFVFLSCQCFFNGVLSKFWVRSPRKMWA